MESNKNQQGDDTPFGLLTPSQLFFILELSGYWGNSSGPEGFFEYIRLRCQGEKRFVLESRLDVLRHLQSQNWEGSRSLADFHRQELGGSPLPDKRVAELYDAALVALESNGWVEREQLIAVEEIYMSELRSRNIQDGLTNRVVSAIVRGVHTEPIAFAVASGMVVGAITSSFAGFIVGAIAADVIRRVTQPGEIER